VSLLIQRPLIIEQTQPFVNVAAQFLSPHSSAKQKAVGQRQVNRPWPTGSSTHFYQEGDALGMIELRIDYESSEPIYVALFTILNNGVRFVRRALA
jgi:hypothetical protein